MSDIDYETGKDRLVTGFPKYFEKLSEDNPYWLPQYKAAQQIADILGREENLSQEGAFKCAEIFKPVYRTRDYGSGYEDLGMHLNALIKYHGLVSTVYED